MKKDTQQLKNASDWLGQFYAEVNESHIKYDWDGGHAYSYIDHPLMDQLYDTSFHMSYEDSSFCEEKSLNWLYDNDDCPPCELHIIDNQVCSPCGCYSHLDYERDKDEVEDIIEKLMEFKK